MTKGSYHPCIGSRCARSDGITCADDACDLDLGIYAPKPGDVTREQAAYIQAMKDRREELAGEEGQMVPCRTE